MTSTKVRMPSLVNTMLIHWREELNVLKKSVCNYFHPMWKLISCTMVANVSQITSWVLRHSLPWAQHKRWIPIGSMGCVHTHWRILTFEGWGNPIHIRSTMKKNQRIWSKVWKYWLNRKLNTYPWPKDDRIRAWWASNISSNNMLERLWWCRCSEMESWSQTICYLLSCSNKGKHAWVGGGRKSHVTLKCCWKGKVLLSTCVETSRSKGHWSTINLTTMIEVIRAQFLK